MRSDQVEQQVRTGWAGLDTEAVHDRIRGCLFSVACGDALGAVFEGTPVVSAADVDVLWRGHDELRYTDDTVMTLVLGRHLALELDSGADLVEDELLAAFADAWRAEPWRGYGPGPQQVFRSALSGLPWQRAAGELFGGAGSFGNGGAMRVAPAALVGRPLPQVLEWARRSARVTHTHPLGQAGAALQAAAVSLAISSNRHARLSPERFLAALQACQIHPEYAARLRRVTYLLDDERPGRAARALGHGIAALESVPAAILAFLRHPDDPAAVIEFAIRLGGDTDTIAAMAGAIVGARCGGGAVPADWLRRLEPGHGITQVADMLARAAIAAAPPAVPRD